MEPIDLTKLTDKETQLASEAIAVHRRIINSYACAALKTSTILDAAKDFKDWLLRSDNVGKVKIRQETFESFLENYKPLSDKLDSYSLWIGVSSLIKEASQQYSEGFRMHVESPHPIVGIRLDQ